MSAMGVPRDRLPSWDDIQFVTAQLARRPLLDDDAVGTDVIIGASAAHRCASRSRSSSPT